MFNNDSDPLEYTTFETANGVRATPVIVNDTLFIGSQDFIVYAVPLEDFENNED